MALCLLNKVETPVLQTVNQFIILMQSRWREQEQYGDEGTNYISWSR